MPILKRRRATRLAVCATTHEKVAHRRARVIGALPSYFVELLLRPELLDANQHTAAMVGCATPSEPCHLSTSSAVSQNSTASLASSSIPSVLHGRSVCNSHSSRSPADHGRSVAGTSFRPEWDAEGGGASSKSVGLNGASRSKWLPQTAGAAPRFVCHCAATKEISDRHFFEKNCLHITSYRKYEEVAYLKSHPNGTTMNSLFLIMMRLINLRNVVFITRMSHLIATRRIPYERLNTSWRYRTHFVCKRYVYIFIFSDFP